MSLGQVEVKSAQDGTQRSQTHTALCLPVGIVPSKIAKIGTAHCDGLHLPKKPGYTPSAPGTHDFENLTQEPSMDWKIIMSLDLGFLLFNSIFKMIYPPNHSVHMSLHRKALTL